MFILRCKKLNSALNEITLCIIVGDRHRQEKRPRLNTSIKADFPQHI